MNPHTFLIGAIVLSAAVHFYSVSRSVGEHVGDQFERGLSTDRFWPLLRASWPLAVAVAMVAWVVAAAMHFSVGLAIGVSLVAGLAMAAGMSLTLAVLRYEAPSAPGEGTVRTWRRAIGVSLVAGVGVMLLAYLLLLAARVERPLALATAAVMALIAWFFLIVLVERHGSASRPKINGAIVVTLELIAFCWLVYEAAASVSQGGRAG